MTTKPHPAFPFLFECSPGLWTHPLMFLLPDGTGGEEDIAFLRALGFKADARTVSFDEDEDYDGVLADFAAWVGGVEVAPGYTRLTAAMHEDGDGVVIWDVCPLTPLARVLLARAEGRVTDAQLDALAAATHGTPSRQDEAFEAVRRERAYQDAKWGTIHERPHTVGEWLLIVKGELDEAVQAWQKGAGDRDALEEITQVAAVALACMEQHGPVSRPSVAATRGEVRNG